MLLGLVTIVVSMEASPLKHAQEWLYLGPLFQRTKSADVSLSVSFPIQVVSTQILITLDGLLMMKMYNANHGHMLI